MSIIGGGHSWPLLSRQPQLTHTCHDRPSSPGVGRKTAHIKEQTGSCTQLRKHGHRSLDQVPPPWAVGHSTMRGSELGNPANASNDKTSVYRVESPLLCKASGIPTQHTENIHANVFIVEHAGCDSSDKSFEGMFGDECRNEGNNTQFMCPDKVSLY